MNRRLLALALACVGLLTWGGATTAVGGHGEADCSVSVSMDPGGVERSDTVSVLNNSTTRVTVRRADAARAGVDCPDTGTLAVVDPSNDTRVARTQVALTDDKTRSTVEFRVPESLAPGAYTLRASAGNATGTARFRVIDPAGASIGNAIITDYGSTSTAPGEPSIQNVVLPQGGYLELRDGNATVARSDYLPRGAYRLVAVDVDEIQTYRVVAVSGTPDAVGDRILASEQVSVGPYVRTPTPTPTPAPPPTPTTATPTTATELPGFGLPAGLVSVSLYAAYRLRRARA